MEFTKNLLQINKYEETSGHREKLICTYQITREKNFFLLYCNFLEQTSKGRNTQLLLSRSFGDFDVNLENFVRKLYNSVMVIVNEIPKKPYYHKFEFDFKSYTAK